MFFQNSERIDTKKGVHKQRSLAYYVTKNSHYLQWSGIDQFIDMFSLIFLPSIIKRLTGTNTGFEFWATVAALRA